MLQSRLKVICYMYNVHVHACSHGFSLQNKFWAVIYSLFLKRYLIFGIEHIYYNNKLSSLPI